jgi:hypothetical protein
VTSPVDRAPSRSGHPIRRWFRLWRVEPVEIVSPLCAEAVEARLAAGLTTRRQPLVGQCGDADARVVLGRVSRPRVRLTAQPQFVRNSWSPVFRGQLLPTGAGCRLVGTIGWHPFTRIFTAVWLTIASLFLIGGTVGFAVLVAAGHGIADDVPMVLVPAGMLCLGGGLVTGAGRAGWRDAVFLRSWLAKRLQTVGSA